MFYNLYSLFFAFRANVSTSVITTLREGGELFCSIYCFVFKTAKPLWLISLPKLGHWR